MVSFLDCIERVPEVLEGILKERENYFSDLRRAVADRRVDEIIFIGFRTANTTPLTSRPFFGKGERPENNGGDSE